MCPCKFLLIPRACVRITKVKNLFDVIEHIADYIIFAVGNSSVKLISTLYEYDN